MGEKHAYKPSARRLIDTAERLFGEFGVEQVSLQRIAEEAGQANKYAVQYHFGSRDGLIAAIIDTRLPVIDARRRLYLEELKAGGTLDVRNLIWTLFRPVIEEVDGDGKHRFASFTGRLRLVPKLRAPWFTSPYLSSASEVTALLRQATPHLSAADFDIRMMMVTDIFSSTMRMIDDPITLHDDANARPPEADTMLGHAIDICVAAMAAPVRQTADRGR